MVKQNTRHLKEHYDSGFESNTSRALHRKKKKKAKNLKMSLSDVQQKGKEQHDQRKQINNKQ